MKKWGCNSKKLKADGFEEVLKSYIKLHERYLDFSEDCGFDYTEMTNVSMLASAASVAGWSALCEFQHMKPKKSDKRKDANGRADLYLISNNKQYRQYYCEAKQKRIGASRLGRDWIETFRAVMESAKVDTEATCNVRKQKNEPGLALSFFNLYVKRQKKENHYKIAEELNQFFQNTASKRINAWALFMNAEPVDMGYQTSLMSGSVLIIEEV